jgi:hypothetical protein
VVWFDQAGGGLSEHRVEIVTPTGGGPLRK